MNNIAKVSSILANRIRILRNSRGWTQERLAEEINVHPTYISRIESCKRLPTLYIISLIADAFQIETYELFVDDGDLGKSDYVRKKIINIVNESAPYKIKIYSTLINALDREFRKGKTT